MAITLADVLTPAGEIEPDVFWPGEASADSDARVNGYLTDGATRAAGVADATARDNATRAWTYYRAYESVANRLAGLPAGATLDDGTTVSTTAAQLQAMQDKADKWLAAFEVIVPPAATETANPIQPSAYVPTVVKW
jgi:hypothetical protein